MKPMNWAMMRAVLASVADTGDHPTADVLGLGTEARMNLPAPQRATGVGASKGALSSELAEQLRELNKALRPLRCLAKSVSLRQDLEHRAERQAEAWRRTWRPILERLSSSAAVLKKLAGGGPQSGFSDEELDQRAKRCFQLQLGTVNYPLVSVVPAGRLTARSVHPVAIVN